jgi:hypothetical protein
MTLSLLDNSPQVSVEMRKILSAITQLMKLEEEYENKEIGKSSFTGLYNQV